MDFWTGNEAFESYAICSAILVIKMVLSAFYTGYQRSQGNSYASPEDAKLAGTELRESDSPEVARALRIQRNDVENIPAFFAIGLLYVLSGASGFGAAVYCWTFTLARVGHTLAYARGMQPARGILFGVGALANLGMAVNVFWKNL